MHEAAAIVPPEGADPVIQHLRSALALAREERPVSSAFVDHVSLAMLAHLANGHAAPTASGTAGRGCLSARQLRKAREFVASHFDENILSADVADACGLSLHHFSRAFRRTTGVTPRRWLQRYRVDKAKEMLSSSDLAIVQIALGCGFADQSHLTRVFKALEGSSPAAWRRRRAA